MCTDKDGAGRKVSNGKRHDYCDNRKGTRDKYDRTHSFGGGDVWKGRTRTIRQRSKEGLSTNSKSFSGCGGDIPWGPAPDLLQKNRDLLPGDFLLCTMGDMSAVLHKRESTNPKGDAGERKDNVTSYHDKDTKSTTQGEGTIDHYKT